MSKYLAWLIAGGVVLGYTSTFLIFGLMYPHIFPFLNNLWTAMFWIGIISIPVGVSLLLIGLYKRAHRFDSLK